MEYNDELKRLGERFPNKNIGCGNPSAKILVVTQKEGNEDVDFKYLKRLFRNLPDANGKDMDVLKQCYYVVYDEELLRDSFFGRFLAIQYVFPDGNHLHYHNPAKLFGMEWPSNCTIEDGAIQRLFIGHSKAKGNHPDRLMFCTYPFDKVSKTIFCCNKVLLTCFIQNGVTKCFSTLDFLTRSRIMRFFIVLLDFFSLSMNY